MTERRREAGKPQQTTSRGVRGQRSRQRAASDDDAEASSPCNPASQEFAFLLGIVERGSACLASTSSFRIPQDASDLALEKLEDRWLAETQEGSVQRALLALVILPLLSITAAAQVIITPGNTGSALGVTVQNNVVSGGNAEIANAGNGDANVTLRPMFQGEVTGMDEDDVLVVGNDVDAEVTAAGGTITIAGENTTPEVTNPDESEEDVTINLPDGTEVIVEPGNQVDVNS